MKVSYRRAADLTVGNIVMESPEHPAVIVRIVGYKVLWVYCRYTWQTSSESDWVLAECAGATWCPLSKE